MGFGFLLVAIILHVVVALPATVFVAFLRDKAAGT
jgi:hypothetical protein